jgi:hypothetical protein
MGDIDNFRNRCGGFFEGGFLYEIFLPTELVG